MDVFEQQNQRSSPAECWACVRSRRWESWQSYCTLLQPLKETQHFRITCSDASPYFGRGCSHWSSSAPLTLSSVENSLQSSLRCSTILVPCWTPLASAISNTPELRSGRTERVRGSCVFPLAGFKIKRLSVFALIPIPSFSSLTRPMTTCILVRRAQPTWSRRRHGRPPWRPNRIPPRTDRWWCCWPLPGSAGHL